MRIDEKTLQLLDAPLDSGQEKQLSSLGFDWYILLRKRWGNVKGE